MANCWTDCIASTASTCESVSKSTGFSATGHVKAVQLSDGRRLKADLVVIGLGVKPATEWLRGSGLKVEHGVVVRRTGAAEGTTGVVAAGDVARWWHPLYQQHLRIEHWDQASRQGIAAARTLLAGPDNAEEYDAVPYFWSDQYDVKLQLVGRANRLRHHRGHRGSVGDWAFVAAYGKNGRTIAVLSTIPGRVDDYRSAIADRGAFPPAFTHSSLTSLRDRYANKLPGHSVELIPLVSVRGRSSFTQGRSARLFHQLGQIAGRLGLRPTIFADCYESGCSHDGLAAGARANAAIGCPRWPARSRSRPSAVPL